MALVNATYVGTAAQKKVVRIACFSVSKELFTELNMPVGPLKSALLAVNIPEQSLIVGAHVIVEEASNAATTAAITVGTGEGRADLITTADLKAKGVTSDVELAVQTGTGLPLVVELEYVGAVTNVGKAQIIVEYIEYTKNSGEYTQVNN